MKSVAYLIFVSAFLLVTVTASAQSEAALASAVTAAPSASEAAPAPVTTRLSTITFPEPAVEEGFATVRIADAAGETVHRGMMPVSAGARSLDLSAISIPAAGRYTIRVIYPGGILEQELETVYTIAGAARKGEVAAGW